MINLTQAIARVRFLIDDQDVNPLVSDAEITVALQTSLDEVWQMVVGSGANLYTQLIDVMTAPDGSVDMTAINPIKIVSVMWKTGNVLVPIIPTRPGAGTFLVTGAPINIRIIYVPHAVFPATPVTNFVWSTPDINNAVLDQLLCAVAASQVWVKTGEPPLPSLSKRIDELKQSAFEEINIPNTMVLQVRALGRRGSSSRTMSWQRVQHNKLQLIY